MKQTTIVAIILGVLVLISAVQAFQLNTLKENIADGEITIKSSSESTVTTSGEPVKRTASLPSSIKDLPQMVGGC